MDMTTVIGESLGDLPSSAKEEDWEDEAYD